MTERRVKVTVPYHKPVCFDMRISRVQPQTHPNHRIIHRTIIVDQTLRACPKCHAVQWLDDGETICRTCLHAAAED